MTGPELGVWLLLGLILAAPFLLVLPVRGGHGQHAHAGPGTLTVRHLTAMTPSHQPAPEPDEDDSDDEIVWPTARDRRRLEPESPSPIEQDLAELLRPPVATDYVGRHRLDEPWDRYEPLPVALEHTPPTPVYAEAA